jgi:DNA-binding NarL/FixJ family response regulator
MNTTRAIRIAITDDHPMVVKGLRQILEGYDQFEVIASYTSGKALLAGLQRVVPDVLLLDMQLPDITGEELTRNILSRYPALKILILTSHDNVFFIRSLLSCGAMGYVLKTVDEEELVAAIETVHQGVQFLSPEVKDVLVRDTLKLKHAFAGPAELTQREKDIIQLIAEEYTSPEIAEKLFLSPRTVDNYRFGLMQKLEVKNMVGLIKKAIQMGLIK